MPAMVGMGVGRPVVLGAAVGAPSVAVFSISVAHSMSPMQFSYI